MAITTGNDYDHIDIQSGSNTTRHMLKDATARTKIDDLVEVSSTQPASANNQIWVSPSGTEYQVPTYDEFSDLKSAFDNTIVMDSTADVTPGAWTLTGGISAASGANYTSSKLFRFGFTSLAYPIAFDMSNSDYEFVIWTYSAQSAGTGVYSPSGEAYTQNKTIIYPTDTALYFRVGFRRVDQADMTTGASDTTSDEYKVKHSIRFWQVTDKTLTLANAPADASIVGAMLSDNIGYTGFMRNENRRFNETITRFTNEIEEEGLYSGGIDPETGTILSNNWTCRTVFIRYDKRFVVDFTLDGYKYDVWCYRQNSGSDAEYSPSCKRYITGRCHVDTVDKNRLECFRIGFIKEDGTEITSSDEQDIMAALHLYEADDGLDIPWYYFENDYIIDRVNTILSNRESMSDSVINGDEFFWITDVHAWHGERELHFNGMKAVDLIRYIKNRTNIKNVFCGGDMLSGILSKASAVRMLEKMRTYFSPIQRDTYYIVGNHEYNNTSGDPERVSEELNTAILYPILLKDKEKEYGSVSTRMDYYIDNKTQKIRYFFIGCDKTAGIFTETLSWFADEMTKVPDGYTVVVLSHTVLTDNDNHPLAFKTHMAKVMDAAKSKGTYTYDGVEYDYGNTNYIIACAIGGHIHSNSSEMTEQGIPLITTTCDSAPRDETDSEAMAARPVNSIKEQAFDVVQIDTVNRKIRMTRIGFPISNPLTDSDREFSY